MSVIVTQHGAPQPPSDLLTRLRRVHPSLALRWSNMPGRPWALTWEWEEHDVRRERIKQGDIPPSAAFDIIGYLPADCTLDAAGAYVETCLRQYPREEVQKMYARMTHWNETEVPAQQVADVTAAALDEFESSKRQKNARRQQVTVTPS